MPNIRTQQSFVNESFAVRSCAATRDRNNGIRTVSLHRNLIEKGPFVELHPKLTHLGPLLGVQLVPNYIKNDFGAIFRKTDFIA